jgi:hypothetical protein
MCIKSGGRQQGSICWGDSLECLVIRWSARDGCDVSQSAGVNWRWQRVATSRWMALGSTDGCWGWLLELALGKARRSHWMAARQQGKNDVVAVGWRQHWGSKSRKRKKAQQQPAKWREKEAKIVPGEHQQQIEILCRNPPTANRDFHQLAAAMQDSMQDSIFENRPNRRWKLPPFGQESTSFWSGGFQQRHFRIF